MIANILAVIIIAAWTAATIYSIVKKRNDAKKKGVSAGCISCSAYKAGECSSGHCTSEEDVERMIQKAKEILAKKESGQN